jgi:hypothetical protein
MTESKTTNDWIATDDPLEVSPRNDIKDHISGESCWCNPFMDGNVLVHNAMDEREKYERGERQLS